MDNILDTATIEEQVREVIDIARVYNDHKVIKVSVANKLKRHVLDTIMHIKQVNTQQIAKIQSLSTEIDTLNNQMMVLQTNLDEAIQTKRSIEIFGIEIDKVLYNSVMWLLLAALLFLLVVLFLMYKRSFKVTNQTRKDLEELKETHDNYRKDSREKMEKLVVKHHQELKKYKNA